MCNVHLCINFYLYLYNPPKCELITHSFIYNPKQNNRHSEKDLLLTQMNELELPPPEGAGNIIPTYLKT